MNKFDSNGLLVELIGQFRQEATEPDSDTLIADLSRSTELWQSDYSKNLKLALCRLLWRLSAFASGRTAPNPPVACVVFSADLSVVVAGATEPAGRRHAEVVALDWLDRNAGSVHDRQSKIIPLTLAVTLEPCSHYGRTPPCTERIVDYGPHSEFAKKYNMCIDTVLIGESDPSIQHQSVDFFNAHGIKVRRLSDDCSTYRSFFRPFLLNLNRKRPVFHVKIATDLSGLMGSKNHRLSITGESGQRFTMRLRAGCDAVIVGPGTIATDRPSLDLRPPFWQNDDQVNHLHQTKQFDQQNKERQSWFASLFDDGCGWLTIQSSIELIHQFEPARVFLLGRSFDHQKQFFKNQDQLAIKSGRPAVYFCFDSSKQDWPMAITLPDLDDSSFFKILSEQLADLGLYRVLVESGFGMLPKWISFLDKHDSLLHVSRLDRPADVATDPGNYYIDTDFRQLTLLDEYHLSQNLKVRLFGAFDS